MTIELGPVVPILRMFDVAATRRSYVGYLAAPSIGRTATAAGRCICRCRAASSCCTCPPTTTTARLAARAVEIRGVEALHAELRGTGYPGIEQGPGDGREMVLIDPASNRLRFYERGAPG